VTPSFRIEVDQSGKIETPHLTALAFSNSNGRQYAILIPTRVKREVLSQLRARGLSRSQASIPVFAAALWLLLRDVIGEVTDVVIDTEYTGHEAHIKAELVQLAIGAGAKIVPNVIRFARIGKKSRAHQRVIEAYRGKHSADHVIDLVELTGVLGKKK
jgi:hypothetical protein